MSSTCDDDISTADTVRQYELPPLSLSSRLAESSSDPWKSQDRVANYQLPEISSARSDSRIDRLNWASQTHTNLRSARLLRQELGSETSVEPSKPIARPCGKNTTALQDRLKMKAVEERRITDELLSCISQMEDTQLRTRKVMADLNRSSGKIWASLNVAEKRIQVREGKPPQEQVQDALQDALEKECEQLSEAHKTLGTLIASGLEKSSVIDRAIAAMMDQRLTLPQDRTQFPKHFLRKMRILDDECARFCKTADSTLRKFESVASKAQRRTQSAMKKCFSELHQIKRNLEDEIEQNRRSIISAERALEKWSNTLKEHSERPEHAFQGEDIMDSRFSFKALYERAKLSVTALQKVRATIKGAAYTGHAGRQLHVLFSRMDRDGSGELDEDEVMKVIRCTLKVPPNAIADYEVVALCETLDADGSGSVNIEELVAFLNADVDVENVTAQHDKTRGLLDQLQQAHEELLADLRNKRNAWLVDKACMQVDVVKGLELDTHLSSRKESEEQGCRRAKPLEPRVLEKVRAKLSKAIEGRSIETLLGQFDKDSSGQLDESEFLCFLREIIGVPKYAVSDAEVSSLCSMLDSDSSGSISIVEVVDFLSQEPQRQMTTPEPLKMVEGRLKPGMRRDAPLRASKPTGSKKHLPDRPGRADSVARTQASAPIE